MAISYSSFCLTMLLMQRRRQALEGRLTGKGKAENDEDGLDDLFGDVGSEDGSSGSDEDSADDEATESFSHKHNRNGASTAAASLGDGLTFHEGRLVIEVSYGFL